MGEITFEQIPKAITQLFQKLEVIERLLNSQNSQPAAQQEQWFDITQLCEYLPDKPVKPTVYGWVHKKVIPNHRRGKKLYFLKSEIDEWLRAGRNKTISETAQEATKYINKSKI